MTIKMIVLAIVFMARAPQWVASAGAESELTEAPECAGIDKATCEEESSAQGNEEASLLQVSIGAHSQANATKVNQSSGCKQDGLPRRQAGAGKITPFILAVAGSAVLAVGLTYYFKTMLWVFDPVDLESTCGKVAENPQTSWTVCCMQVLFCIYQVLDRATWTAPIPTSYDLASELGSGATMSGFIIGSFGMLVPVFAVSTKWLIGSDDARNRNLILTSVVFTVTMVLLFAFAANPPPPFQLGARLRLGLLVIARVAMGASILGIGFVVLKVVVQKMTLSSEGMKIFQMQAQVGNMIGIASGPFLSSMASLGLDATSIGEKSAAPFYFLSAFWLALLLATVWIFDRPKEEVQAPDAVQTSGSSSVVWWCALLYDFERVLSVGAIEAASSLIFETEFGINTTSVGVLIGASFLAGLPLSMALLGLRRHLNVRDTRMGQVNALCGVATTLLLWPGLGRYIVGQRLNGDMSCILLADALMLPMFLFSKGLLDAFAANLASSEGMYTQENLVIGQMILSSVSRELGPMLARFALSHGGRVFYICIQVAITSVSCLTVFKATLTVESGTFGRESQ